MEQKLISNRYLIVNQIGYSGFSAVYKAWDNILERYVAIKKISEDFSTDPNLLKIFREEALNAAKLQHENIVQIFDFLQPDDNSRYVVMEYIEGIDLGALMKRSVETKKPIPVELCAKIVRDIAIALDYAYQKKDDLNKNSLNLIHQDISPSNILIHFDGRVKLSDFGISRVIKKIISEEGNSYILEGKYHYMSPEQAAGSAYITRKSDMYSLGVVFLELLSSKSLFEGTGFEVAEKVKLADFDKTLLENLKDPIKTILSRMLNKEPEDRPGTTEEIISVLSQFIRERRYGQKKRDLAKFIFDIFGYNPAQNLKEKHPASGYIKPEELGSERDPVAITPFLEDSFETGKIPAKPSISNKFPVKPKKEIKLQIKKYLIPGFLLLLLVIGSFELFFDIPAQKTGIGKYFNKKLSTPLNVSINSIPGQAAISLIDKAGADILNEAANRSTPLKLTNIKPGTYKIIIKKEGYQDVVRQIELLKSAKDYIFQFDTKLEITSDPSGMDIYISGKPTSLKTPSTILLGVGKHAIKIGNNEIGMLGSESIDTTRTEGRCIIDFIENKHLIDAVAWKLTSFYDISNVKIYQLKGSLLNTISINSIPAGAEVYFNNNFQKSFGRTPLKIMMPAGKYKITLQKKGFTNEDNPDLRVPVLLKYETEISVKSGGDNEFSCILKE